MVHGHLRPFVLGGIEGQIKWKYRRYPDHDLLITKAGGLTTTEAVAAGVPIFYLDAIPGCESRNIDFMTRHGYALAIRAEEELPALLQGCLSGALDPTAMVRRRSETFPRHAAANIVKLLSE